LACSACRHQDNVTICAIAAQPKIAAASVYMNAACAIVGIQQQITVSVVTAGRDVSCGRVDVITPPRAVGSRDNGVAYREIGADAGQTFGVDDSADVGISLCGPVCPEAICDFPVDDGGS
jgi:hypothetical protein